MKISLYITLKTYTPTYLWRILGSKRQNSSNIDNYVAFNITVNQPRTYSVIFRVKIMSKSVWETSKP